MKKLQALPLLGLMLLPLAGFHSTAKAAGKAVDYQREVRPVLSRYCFQCHGPDDKARKAKLRLDLREGALKPAKSGTIPIVPGKLEKSEIVRRIFSL